MQRQELVDVLQQTLLQADREDFCPNGLQVEGCNEIQTIITGVTASQALIDRAVAAQADALLVHHGYFWRQEPAVVVGMKRKRLQQLLMHDINLFAYHLPLDIHPCLGNNVQLGRVLGITECVPILSIHPVGIVWQGILSPPLHGSTFAEQIEHRLQRKPLHCGESGPTLIQKLAWCSGGGQAYFLSALATGIDAFITGEVSEQTIHIAREMGIHFYAVGHHASERYGVQALGEWLAEQYGYRVCFIDIDNPA